MIPRSPHGPSAAVLTIVRLVIVVSVTLFTGFAWWLHHSGALVPNLIVAPILGIVVMAVGIALALGLFVIRALRDRAPNRGGRAIFTVVAWALGEAAAFLGVVYYMVTGSASRLWPGALLLALALVMFPIPGDERPSR